MKFGENSLKSFEKIQVSLKSDKSNGYFTWRPMCTMISHWIILTMKNVSGRSRENQNTYLYSISFPFQNRAIDEIIWKNIVERGRPLVTRHMRTECWIPKATNIVTICNTYCSSPAKTVAETQYPLWAPWPVWTGVENLAPTWIRCPDRPACSESLYPPPPTKI